MLFLEHRISGIGLSCICLVLKACGYTVAWNETFGRILDWEFGFCGKCVE
jgi:hypothetical protein